jgi:hypothetical protein
VDYRAVKQGLSSPLEVWYLPWSSYGACKTAVTRQEREDHAENLGSSKCTLTGEKVFARFHFGQKDLFARWRLRQKARDAQVELDGSDGMGDGEGVGESQRIDIRAMSDREKMNDQNDNSQNTRQQQLILPDSLPEQRLAQLQLYSTDSEAS